MASCNVICSCSGGAQWLYKDYISHVMQVSWKKKKAQFFFKKKGIIFGVFLKTWFTPSALTFFDY